MLNIRYVFILLPLTLILATNSTELKPCNCNNGYPVLHESCHQKIEKCFGCNNRHYLNVETQACVKKSTNFNFQFVSHSDNMKIGKHPSQIAARGNGHLSAFTKLLTNSTSYHLIHFRIHEYDGALKQGECVSNGGQSYRVFKNRLKSLEFFFFSIIFKFP